jgi:hypothetical protein
MTRSIPRNVRDANPGNIDQSNTKWQGLMPYDQQSPIQRAETRFAVFVSPRFGFRALCATLRTYIVEDDCRTIEEIVSRWAPPVENNTAAYIQCVQLDTGFSKTAVLVPDGPTLYKLAHAITTQETGGVFNTWWKAADLQWGSSEVALEHPVSEERESR